MAKKATKSSSNEKAKQQTSQVKKDKWGSRAGTQVARINKAITRKGKTIKEIAEAANAHLGATQSHVRSLRNKGHITVENGIVKEAK